MQPHCYYLTVSASLSLADSEKGRRNHRNFKILSDKKGKALADDLENQVRAKYCKINGDSPSEIFNLAIDNIFDCGEEPEASDETI